MGRPLSRRVIRPEVTLRSLLIVLMLLAHINPKYGADAGRVFATERVSQRGYETRGASPLPVNGQRFVRCRSKRRGNAHRKGNHQTGHPHSRSAPRLAWSQPGPTRQFCLAQEAFPPVETEEAAVAWIHHAISFGHTVYVYDVSLHVQCKLVKEKNGEAAPDSDAAP